ncbi:ATP-dependent endonuclease [Xanthomonas euvesicatoria]|uniref:ATP-dependent nuclease n=1 Tax=Xanthomonas euvesicatoria TaxID=456327 RepID=UPI00259CD178|nr:AAA family ATPase [Xanthomonas euvesicatoria]MDM4821306.1 AAA family ATPase [Xanthomonas euvesicatoria]
MAYRESQADKGLRAWFISDNTKALLRGIKLIKGSIRGINSLDIEFHYPIAAFAGVNGAGKSTILALASCAFHNNPGGYKLKKRQTTYYTFKDFFVQHSDEIAPDGIEIRYEIAHNNWKKTDAVPSGVGVAAQSRVKKKGGKWNDYDKRIKRDVVFLGIERIVPHSERSQSKSYSRSFKDAPLKGWEAKVKEAVGTILNKKYDDFRYLEHSKYNLPLVKCGPLIYSGFNMGAGENALFEIFSIIYSCNKGALLVMDEAEPGLHAKAQRLFIKKLKDVCVEMNLQVICTTHSREIFDCLPEDARFFVEAVGGKTRITSGVSSEFAFSKLSGAKNGELDIFVEDPVAHCLILSSLPATLRSRVSVQIIGSATAISRQLAAHYVRKDARPVLAIFDGDQRSKYAENLKHARNMAENPKADFDEWFTSRCAFLPGETWPEAWVIQKCLDTSVLEKVSESLLLDADEVTDILEYGLQAGKHDEFHEVASHIGLNSSQCMSKLCDTVTHSFSSDFEEIKKAILILLSK